MMQIVLPSYVLEWKHYILCREKTKYLGYMFTNDKQDDVEMLRLLRILYMYMRSNKIIRMFYF